MATYHKGHGGKMTVGSDDVHVVDWEFTKTTRKADLSNSGSNGWAPKKGTVKEASGTVNALWDSDQLPDTDITLDVGDEFTLKLYCGDSTKFYSMTAMVESLKMNSKSTDDVVRWTITFDAWDVTNPITG